MSKFHLSRNFAISGNFFPFLIDIQIKLKTIMKKDISKKHQPPQHDLLKKEEERILSLMVDETSYNQYIDRLYEIHNKMNELEEKINKKINKKS